MRGSLGSLRQAWHTWCSPLAQRHVPETFPSPWPRTLAPGLRPHASDMDLRQLEILQAIAETGSFTACGKTVHVSQAAISRQVMLLEEELGEPLFLRVGRKVRMTPAAEGLVQLGKRGFQGVRETG